MQYTWEYKHWNGTTVLATGDWEGSHQWSVVRGSEKSKIHLTPGWVAGTNTYTETTDNIVTRQVDVDPVPTDLSDWELDPERSNYKRWAVNQTVDIKQIETTRKYSYLGNHGLPVTNNSIVKKFEKNDVHGDWIEF